MITTRPSTERGHADHGWLKTSHTFSFAGYRDSRHMGFRALRVINEDRVAPGRGFDTHEHRDMEILTYILSGALRHEDSMGTGEVIGPHDVQRMTAGTGIYHSEFNDSDNDEVHLLQIWIFPEKKGLTPGYEQKEFTPESKQDRLCLIASPDARDGSLRINQDVFVYASLISEGAEIKHRLAPDRHAWIQVARGSVALNGAILSAGDGAAISNEQDILLAGITSAEILVFDLA